MANISFWRYIFYSKGVINWIESLALLWLDPWLRSKFHLPILVNFEYVYLFAALAFVFGSGYWQVGRDTAGNRTVIAMGVLGQYSVFFILMAVVGAIDGIFASFYLRYLWITAPNARSILLE